MGTAHLPSLSKVQDVREGKIVAERTSGGHRRYDVAKLLGTSERFGKTICYARVSTRPQKEDLQRQSIVLASYCEKQGWEYEIITYLRSGINYNKRGLTKLVRLLIIGEVKRLVVTNKDQGIFTFDASPEKCRVY